MQACDRLGYRPGDLDSATPRADVTLCRVTGDFATARCRELGHAYRAAIPYPLAPKSECAGHREMARDAGD